LPPPASGPANLAQLQTAIQQIITVEDSAVKLINGMAEELNKMTANVPPGGSVPVSQLNALAQQLKQSTEALAQAVKANTPASALPPASGTAPTSGTPPK
jgi:hypothetical protein